MQGHLRRPAVRAPPQMRGPRKHSPPQRPLAEQSATLAAFWFTIRKRDWMTEEAARAHRRHSLLQDNPTAG